MPLAPAHFSNISRPVSDHARPPRPHTAPRTHDHPTCTTTDARATAQHSDDARTTARPHTAAHPTGNGRGSPAAAATHAGHRLRTGHTNRDLVGHSPQPSGAETLDCGQPQRRRRSPGIHLAARRPPCQARTGHPARLARMRTSPDTVTTSSPAPRHTPACGSPGSRPAAGVPPPPA